MLKVDNAIIMAAGTASRFAPISFERPKALIPVRGEVLLERQIRQLKEAGVPEIYVIVGYKAEQFYYLQGKFGVKILENPDFNTRNNNASINVAKHLLGNSYICSADNYFLENPFEREVSECYYSAVYSKGETKEWCMEFDSEGIITDVKIGGRDAWYMLGHAFWSADFSRKFIQILDRIYNLPETADKLWESIYIDHIQELPMKLRQYGENVIFEFDTLDELREFDQSYVSNTRSQILKSIAKELSCEESEITNVKAFKDDSNEAAGFTFDLRGESHSYLYKKGILKNGKRDC